LKETFGFRAVVVRRRSATIQDFLRLFRLEIRDLAVGEPAGMQRRLGRARDQERNAGHDSSPWLLLINGSEAVMRCPPVPSSGGRRLTF
jgi:hypothetical protein